MTTKEHISVLLQEVLDGLAIAPGDIIVDGTLGNGGHTEEILKRGGDSIRLIGLDADPDAIDRVKNRLGQYGNATFVNANFRDLDTVLASLGVSAVNKILLDLGLSSIQIEHSGRGFSFNRDEPLLMTFKKESGEGDVTAEVVVNEWSQETLETILKGFGEERYARSIAAEIISRRRIKPFKTTGELVEAILAATPASSHHRRLHPATKTFQAIRIAVNDELGALETVLKKGWEKLAPGGRMAVISFHSLEDRIVKRFFKERSQESDAELISKKAIQAEREEQVRNPRSRSAKLRILMKKEKE